MSRTIGIAPPDDVKRWSKEMSEIMDVAVKKAIEENRRLGLENFALGREPDSVKVAEPGAEEQGGS